MYDVFISYKSEEAENAKWLKTVLEINGLSCWMAPDSIPGGSSYAQEIEQAIYDCGVLILLLSDKAQKSIWIEKELSLALSNNKRVFPFMLSNCDIVKPYNFYLTDVERYAAYEDKARVVKKMVSEIYAHLGKKQSIHAPSFEELHIGDTITFGAYYFDTEHIGKTPILWNVIDETNSTLLLISNFCQDIKPYNLAKDQNTSWAECSLRKWLNTTFMTIAFDANQQNYICPKKLMAEDNPEHTTAGGKETEDRVFILSVSELERYFSSNEKRKAPLTPYAKSQLTDIKENCIYYKHWVRGPGYYQYRAIVVDDNGRIDIDGYSACRNTVAIRPAIWIYRNLYS